MRRFALSFCLAALAAPLACIPAWADTPLQPGEQTLQVPSNSETAETPREKRVLREERLKLRAEHENMESEHDRLKVACLNAKGQDRTDCEQKKQALREQMDDWHKRHKAFEEQVAAQHPDAIAPHTVPDTHP